MNRNVMSRSALGRTFFCPSSWTDSEWRKSANFPQVIQSSAFFIICVCLCHSHLTTLEQENYNRCSVEEKELAAVKVFKGSRDKMTVLGGRDETDVVDY